MTKGAASSPAFQQEAVKRIVSRLGSKGRSRRFLLADEVGLGKTHVARNVIERLFPDSRRACRVLYICSNLEIARQNGPKLLPNTFAGDRKRLYSSVDRLTLLPLEGPLRRGFKVLAFTPGRALRAVNGSGTKKERRLLLYLILQQNRHLGRPAYNQLRDSLRCSAASPTWKQECQRDALRRDFGHGFPDSLVARLCKGRWSRTVKKWRDDGCQRKGIGSLRAVLAEAVLRVVSPDLIVMDEFQKYPNEFLPALLRTDESRVDNVLQRFLGTEGKRAETPILLLSATPYRLYPTAKEDDGQDLLNEFYRVLAFLRRANGGMEDNWSRDLKEKFRALRTGLKELAHPGAASSSVSTLDDLYAARKAIEGRLRPIICRIERLLYLDGQVVASKEVPLEGPGTDALLDLKTLHDATRDGGILPGELLDYWKSSPACLSFMDAGYKAIRDFPQRRNPALIRERGLARILNTSDRLRALLTVASGGSAVSDDSTPRAQARPWDHPWCRPSYQYWTDRDDHRGEPRKLLVFSHWRFVPGALSLLLSDAAERGLGVARDAAWRSGGPIRLDESHRSKARHVCLPSLALASIVDPLKKSLHTRKKRPLRDFEIDARTELIAALRKCQVTIGPRRGDLWDAIARLEAHPECWIRRNGDPEGLSIAFQKVLASAGGPTTRSVLSDYRDAIDQQKVEPPFTISRKELKELVQVALHSPAVCVLRSFLGAWERSPEAEPDAVQRSFTALLNACIDGVRHYFNRPFIQRMVRRANPTRSYVEGVLRLVADRHWQATIDEYLFLLMDNNDPVEALDILNKALRCGSGSPRVRFKGIRKRTSSPRVGFKDGQSRRMSQRRSHFALAFGEKEDAGSVHGKQGLGAKGHDDTRTYPREAFNSPFWPFVLITTSTGQEGLDFHYYCSDVVHWNLPSNPVDLEQREGRVNRRHGIAIRSEVARREPLRSLPLKRSPFQEAFESLQVRDHTHDEKHGLFPRWIVDSHHSGAQRRICRHLLLFPQSRDVERYERLKSDLMLYRLALGQPRQEDLLARLGSGDPTILREFAVNLSPFGPGYARRIALLTAKERLQKADKNWLGDLRKDAKRILTKDRRLSPTGREAGAACLSMLETCLGTNSAVTADKPPDTQLVRAVAALVYLRNPFDDNYDMFPARGFGDDERTLLDLVPQQGSSQASERKRPSASMSART